MTAKRNLSLQELTQRNVTAIAALEQTELHRRSSAARVADAIADFCGSTGFVYCHAVWFAGWILANSSTVASAQWRFDPYPYQLLTLVVSLEAIFLSTFILMSQNRQARISERRNQLDLQINLLSEQENSKILSMLVEIGRRVGAEVDDAEARALEEGTQPELVLEQIQQSCGVPPK